MDTVQDLYPLVIREKEIKFGSVQFYIIVMERANSSSPNSSKDDARRIWPPPAIASTSRDTSNDSDFLPHARPSTSKATNSNLSYQQPKVTVHSGSSIRRLDSISAHSMTTSDSEHVSDSVFKRPRSFSARKQALSSESSRKSGTETEWSPDEDTVKLSSYKTTTAVSVSQIIKLTTETSGLTIHEHKVYNINLVALIYEIIYQSSTKLIALLDDYTTGPVELNYTTGEIPSLGEIGLEHREQYQCSRTHGSEMFEDELSKPITDLRENDYIRVIGQVKMIGNKPVVFAFTIKYICDPNFITMHILEVIRDSLFYEKRAKELKDKAARVPSEKPRWYHALGGRDLELFLFVKDNAGERGCEFEKMQERFRVWSQREMEEAIANIERAGLMWQGDREDLWVPNIHDV